MLSFQGAHSNKWVSAEYFGAKSSIASVLQIATLLSGLTYSAVALFLKFSGIAFIGANNFYKTQHVYAKAISAFYERHMAAVRARFPEDGRKVTCLADSRYDTPGQIITYDKATNRLFHNIYHWKNAL